LFLLYLVFHRICSFRNLLLLFSISGAFGGILDVHELQFDNGRGMAWRSGAKSQYGCTKRSQDEEPSTTRPTTRSGCRSSSTTRSTTRPGCGPSHQNQAQLGPQLDRVVARVRITETNSVHNSTELWPESAPGISSWICFFLCCEWLGPLFSVWLCHLQLMFPLI